MDRAKAMARQHPEWVTKQPFASALKGDMAGVVASGGKGVLEIITVTHAGMTTDEFVLAVQEWITSAKHPETGRLYTEMVYQPMVELLIYLRSNGFKTFIVSGGGVEFMRVDGAGLWNPAGAGDWQRRQIDVEITRWQTVLIKLPEVDFIDDKESKPIQIQTGSAVDLSPPSATLTATYRCCSGPLLVMVHVSPSSFITTTRNGSLRTTGQTSSSISTRVGTRRWRRAGSS